MRKKHKKTIKLSDVDVIWKQYVEYGIIKPLINVGKVQIDKNFSLEIEGERIIENKKTMALVLSGKMLTDYGRLREGLIFRIVAVDKNFKEGNLHFTPSNFIRDKVVKALKETNNYYRIK